MKTTTVSSRLIIGALAALSLSATAARAQSASELPPGPHRDLVYGQCRTCHDLQYLKESAGIPRNAWADILDSMKQYGLRIPPEQRSKIIDYLATYLGPNPPTQGAEDESATRKSATIDAAKLFDQQCSTCHQPNGQGVAGQFPPLAGNRDLFLSLEFPVRVLLGGMRGRIEVNGTTYDGAMPSFSHLSDAQIAALVRYVRHAWSNERLKPPGMQTLNSSNVAELRKHEAKPTEVGARRERLKSEQQR